MRALTAMVVGIQCFKLFAKRLNFACGDLLQDLIFGCVVQGKVERFFIGGTDSVKLTYISTLFLYVADRTWLRSRGN